MEVTFVVGRKKHPYVGLVPFPLPESMETELRENVPFKARLTVIRRCTNNQGALAVDRDGRCFRIFRAEVRRLESYLDYKLKIGARVDGEWVFHRKGPAFGLLPLKLKNGNGQYRNFSENVRGKLNTKKYWETRKAVSKEVVAV